MLVLMLVVTVMMTTNTCWLTLERFKLLEIYGIRNMGYGIRDTGYGIRDTGHGELDIGLWTIGYIYAGWTECLLTINSCIQNQQIWHGKELELY